MTAGEAPDAVRRLLAVAERLLRRDPEKDRPESLTRTTPRGRSALERVARLRDELHITANRVDRFGVDEHPVVDSVRVKAPTAASAALGPGQLLFQLDLAAGRLIAALAPLSAGDWARTCRMGDRIVTLGDLVGGVLDGATHDLLDLLQATPVPAPERTAARAERSRRGRDSPLPNLSTAREAKRDAAVL